MERLQFQPKSLKLLTSYVPRHSKTEFYELNPKGAKSHSHSHSRPGPIVAVAVAMACRYGCGCDCEGDLALWDRL